MRLLRATPRYQPSQKWYMSRRVHAWGRLESHETNWQVNSFDSEEKEKTAYVIILKQFVEYLRSPKENEGQLYTKLNRNTHVASQVSTSAMWNTIIDACSLLGSSDGWLGFSPYSSRRRSLSVKRSKINLETNSDDQWSLPFNCAVFALTEK